MSKMKQSMSMNLAAGFKQCFLLLVFFTSMSFAFAQNLSVTQSLPASIPLNSEFKIEITIKKKDVDGFAKLVYDLPQGFTALSGEATGGSYSTSFNQFKIVWISMPSLEEFKVTIKAKSPVTATSDMEEFGGRLFYMHNNNKVTADIKTQKVKIEAASAKPSEATPTKTTGSITPAKQSGGTPVLNASANTPAVTPASSPSEAVTYRVQLGAAKVKNPQLYAKLKDVSEVEENGMYKYYSGSFKTVEEANKRKEEVSKQGFTGAYVVAFKNGVKIPVPKN